MRIIKQDILVNIFHDKEWFIGWYKSKLRHREGGPAEMWKSISVDKYFIAGAWYMKEDYWKKFHANY